MKRHQRILTNSSGFSLLEVMVSIIILALMSIAVINNTQNSVDTKDNVTKEDQDYLKYFTALSLLRWDIEHLYSPMFFDEKFNINQLASQQNQQSSSNELSTIKQNIESNINSRYRDNPNFFIPSKQGIPIPRISSPEKNILQFFSLGNRRNRANDKSTNFAWVIYRLEQPSEDDIEYLKEFENKDKVQAGQNLVRYQITDNPYSSDDFDLSQYKGQVILDKIEKLEFSFWDDKNKRFDSLNAIKDGEVKVNAIKIIIDYLNMNDQKVHRESIIRVGWSNYHYKPEAKKKNNPSSPTGQPGSPSGTPGSTPPGGGQ